LIVQRQLIRISVIFRTLTDVDFLLRPFGFIDPKQS